MLPPYPVFMLKDGASHSYISEVGYKGFRTMAYIVYLCPTDPLSLAMDRGATCLVFFEASHEALSLEDRNESEDFMRRENGIF